MYRHKTKDSQIHIKIITKDFNAAHYNNNILKISTTIVSSAVCIRACMQRCFDHCGMLYTRVVSDESLTFVKKTLVSLRFV